MDGSFKNIARIALVLTVGLLAATGVGPQTVTHATRALTSAKPTQDAAFALETFFDRFAPAKADDTLPNASGTGAVRLASTDSAATPSVVDADGFFALLSADSPVRVAATDSAIVLTDLEEKAIEKTLTCEITKELKLDRPHDAPRHGTVNRYTVASLPVRTAMTDVSSPLPFRVITTATPSASGPASGEFSRFHYSILRLVGIMTGTRIARFGFTANDDAVFIVHCDDPAS